MSIITRNMINEYEEKKARISEIKSKVFEKTKEILTWENENLGCKHDVIVNSKWRCTNIEIEENGVWLNVEETWSYGGYDNKEIFMSYDKLFSDEWREDALKTYKSNQEKIQKQKLIEVEKKELAELKRLKAKYE